MTDQERYIAGLYRKYDVSRTDGRDDPGEKHDDCRYFVLDITHDPNAAPALRAYAEACKKERPTLAEDLEELALAAELHHDPTFAPDDDIDRVAQRFDLCVMHTRALARQFPDAFSEQRREAILSDDDG